MEMEKSITLNLSLQQCTGTDWKETNICIRPSYTLIKITVGKFLSKSRIQGIDFNFVLV